MIRYEDNGKYAYFNGLKFTRDDKTGYYLNSTIRKRLHRYVWEYYNGEIPPGYHIHHKDGDKSNNDISNLILVAPKKHLGEHGKERFLSKTEWFKKFHSKGIETAKEWHKSKEGKEWHKKLYEETKDRFHKIKKAICEYCGKEYETIDNGRNRFCSNRCKAAWRRKAGLDEVKRICVVCGKEFSTNKYREARTCSRSCASKLLWFVRKNKAN